MGLNGSVEDDCRHEICDTSIEVVRRDEEVGFAFVEECRGCGATWYEPSNLDKFPDTGGLDPRLYEL